MASSVSSERAFSSAGITITKRRNRLKGDVVEALQVLKSVYRRNIFFEGESLDDNEDREDFEDLGNDLFLVNDDGGEFTEPDDDGEDNFTIQSLD